MSQQQTETPPVRDPEPPPEAPRFNLPAVAYPVVALLFMLALVWSFSRILLAVTKDQAPAIALVMALNILVGAALIAHGRRVRHRPNALPLLLVGALLLIAAGTLAFAEGWDKPAEETKAGGHKPPPAGATVQLVAQGLKFEQSTLTMPAGQKVTVDFDNKDSGVPHNFVLFDGPNAQAPVLFHGDLVTGPGTARYTFTAPKPGEYFFHCEVHPTTMSGTAKVTAGGGGPPGGGGGNTATVTAKGLAFSPTALTVSGGGQVTIHLNNQDASIPHNMAVYEDQAYTKKLFAGDLLTGPGQTDYTFPAPPPGTYYFRCEVHTNMQGTLKVG